ncbi:MAG: AEC family transporter [Burkholderiales bacterium]|nr:MAG: AEC family transporter [Burkholderiales bacterium]
MSAIFAVTTPFFALVLCGYLAARGRVLAAGAVPALNGFVLWFALPAMLFRFAANSPFASLVDPPVFATYALCGMLILFASAAGARWALGESPRETAFVGLGAAWSNWGYMGIALIPALLGEQALAVLIAAGMADLLVLVSASLALAALEAGAEGGPLQGLARAVRGMSRNPLIWAVAAGIVCSWLELPLPGPVDTFLGPLGASAGPVALFAMGLSLHRGPGMRLEAGAWPIVYTKLIVHPLLVWLLGAVVVGLSAPKLEAMVLMAALPVAGTVFLFAERNSANSDRAATTIMLSTALAFLSFSALAWLQRAGAFRIALP